MTTPFSFKEVADHIIDMRLQALRPWHPGKFVTFDVIDGKWTANDFGKARVAQWVADQAIAVIILNGGSKQ